MLRCDYFSTKWWDVNMTWQVQMAAVASFSYQASSFFPPNLYFLGSTSSLWCTPECINKQARHPTVDTYLWVHLPPTFFLKVSLYWANLLHNIDRKLLHLVWVACNMEHTYKIMKNFHFKVFSSILCEMWNPGTSSHCNFSLPPAPNCPKHALIGKTEHISLLGYK